MPRVVLLNPPVYDFAFYDLYVKPYGLMRIGRWLADAGYDVRVLNVLDYDDPEACEQLGTPRRKADGTGKLHRRAAEYPQALPSIGRGYYRYGIPEELIERRLRELRPDLVLISTGMTYWYLGVQEAIRVAERVCPGIPVAAGGVYASLLADHCASLGPVEVFPGEIGVEFRSFLAGCGFPVPSASPSERLLTEPSAWRDAGVVRLNTGCPLDCDYCASGILSRYRSGDPDESFEAMNELSSLGIRDFAFYDDALLFSKDASLLPFLRRVIAGGARFRFHLPNAVHVTGLDLETARILAAAGVREIRLGYESPAADFHRVHDRKWQEGDFAAAVDALAGAGFTGDRIGAYVLVGLPGQRVEEAEEAVRHAASFGIDVILSRYSPIPETRLWSESVARCRYPIEEEPLFHDNTIFPMEWEGFTRADLERVHELVVAHRAAVRRE